MANACGSGYASSSAEFFYTNGVEDLVVTILDKSNLVPFEQREGGEIVNLGDLVGYASSEANDDGTSFLVVEFEKDERLYAVGASVSNNNLTADDVTAVALSIAEN